MSFRGPAYIDGSAVTLFHRAGDRGGDTLVEGTGDYLSGGRPLDQRGQVFGGLNLLLTRNLPPPPVERPAEDAREREAVVYLVGIIRAARADDIRSAALGLLGGNLRHRVGHGKHNRLCRHQFDILRGREPRAGHSDERVGPRNCLAQTAGKLARIGAAGKQPLVRLGTRGTDDSFAIEYYDIFYPRFQ